MRTTGLQAIPPTQETTDQMLDSAAIKTIDQKWSRMRYTLALRTRASSCPRVPVVGATRGEKWSMLRRILKRGRVAGAFTPTHQLQIFFSYHRNPRSINYFCSTSMDFTFVVSCLLSLLVKFLQMLRCSMSFVMSCSAADSEMPINHKELSTPRARRTSVQATPHGPW